MTFLYDFEKSLNLNYSRYFPMYEIDKKAGNYILSKILLISNIFLFFYLIILYNTESSENNLSFLNDIIIVSIISLLLSFLNFCLYLIKNTENKIKCLIKIKYYLSIEFFETFIFIITNSLITLPFQIIYSLCKVYSAQSDALFINIAIECILRYSFIIKFYYLNENMNILITIVVFLIHLHFSRDIMSILYIFSSLFVNIYEKYLKYEYFHFNYHSKERNQLIEIIDNIQYAYILSDKNGIIYKNKCFDKLYCKLKEPLINKNIEINTNSDENHISYEKALNLIENLFDSADLVDYFDLDTNLEIVNFFVEKSDGEYILESENSFKILNSKTNKSLESDEETNLNKKKNGLNLKPSLFKKKSNNAILTENKVENSKIPLKNFHLFLEKFRNEYKEFKRLFTIPIIGINETNYYEVQIKIADSLNCDHINYEYIINDVSIIKISDEIKKEVKYKSLFLAKIAHEFKNPIITISNLCQTLNSKVSLFPMNNVPYHESSDEDSDEDKPNCLNKLKLSNSFMSSIQDTTNFISNTGDYMMCLIEDLNYFSKMEHENNNFGDVFENINENLSEFELRPVLEFCLTIFRLRQKQDDNKKGVTILSDYDKKLPNKIFSSEIKLKQILINLLSNAYKFTVYGNIKLSSRMVEKNSKNYIRFEVSDNGIGISDEYMKNISKPFSLSARSQNLNKHGSGLGLFIVKDLLSKINSNLSIQSVEGKGSKFSFDLENSSTNNKKELNNTNISTKTLVHIPVMTDSLKSFYHLHKNLNIHDSEKSDEKSISYLGRGSLDLIKDRNKFDSRNSFTKLKGILQEKSSKRQTLKEFYQLDVSSKNIVDQIHYSNSGIIIIKIEESMKMIGVDSCNSSKTILIHPISNYTSETKKTPFDLRKDPLLVRSFTPKNSSKRNDFSRKKLNEIAEENEIKSVIKIMICDDDSGIRNCIKRLILIVSNSNRIAIDLTESINGIDCLHKIYKDYINGINYDALLIDENMPFMKGSSCIRILKNMYSEGHLNKFRMMSISSNDDNDTYNLLKANGCEEFLPKPHTKEIISKFLNSLII